MTTLTVNSVVVSGYRAVLKGWLDVRDPLGHSKPADSDSLCSSAHANHSKEERRNEHTSSEPSLWPTHPHHARTQSCESMLLQHREYSEPAWIEADHQSAPPSLDAPAGLSSNQLPSGLSSSHLLNLACIWMHGRCLQAALSPQTTSAPADVG